MIKEGSIVRINTTNTNSRVPDKRSMHGKLAIVIDSNANSIGLSFCIFGEYNIILAFLTEGDKQTDLAGILGISRWLWSEDELEVAEP